MDVWDNLLVRHCKGNRFNINILRRILARRCGMATKFIDDWFVAEKLFGIIDNKEGNPQGFLDLIREFSPERAWVYKHGDEKADYWTRVINVLASKIRLTEIVKFPDYRKPLRFRN